VDIGGNEGHKNYLTR